MQSHRFIDIIQTIVIASGMTVMFLHPSFEAALVVIVGILWMAFSQWLDKDNQSRIDTIVNMVNHLQAEINGLSTRLNDAKLVHMMKRGQ